MKGDNFTILFQVIQSLIFHSKTNAEIIGKSPIFRFQGKINLDNLVILTMDSRSRDWGRCVLLFFPSDFFSSYSIFLYPVQFVQDDPLYLKCCTEVVIISVQQNSMRLYTLHHLLILTGYQRFAMQTAMKPLIGQSSSTLWRRKFFYHVSFNSDHKIQATHISCSRG